MCQGGGYNKTDLIDVDSIEVQFHDGCRCVDRVLDVPELRVSGKDVHDGDHGGKFPSV